MGILKYKKINSISPKKFRNHNMYRRKTPQHKETVLEEFIGKFQAKNKINCVNLKHEFKNREV